MGELETDLLTTGQAARLLSASRQHIVDLCDRGTLPFQRSYVHRRVLRKDVKALVRAREDDPMLRREVLRSLWINRAIAGKLAQDPERVLRKGRATLARFAKIHEGERALSPLIWIRRWERLLEEGPEAVMRVLTAADEAAIDMRQTAPFPGVLTARERMAVLRAFSKFWKERRP